MVVDYAKCQPLLQQSDKKVRLLDLLTKRAGEQAGVENSMGIDLISFT